MPRLNIPDRLETGRLFLRRLRYEDAEEIFYAYASKPEATKYLSWPTHESIFDTERFLRRTQVGWSTGTDYSFSIRLKESYRLVGSIGAMNDQGKIQFGYVLSPVQWNHGYATEAVQELMAVLRQQPDVYRIGTFVDAENLASQRVLEKTGFVEEARVPNWYRFVNQGNQPRDCILYRLPLERNTPADPR